MRIALGVRNPMRPVPRTGHVPATSKDVYRNVFLKLFHIDFSEAIRIAMRSHPNNSHTSIFETIFDIALQPSTFFYRFIHNGQSSSIEQQNVGISLCNKQLNNKLCFESYVTWIYFVAHCPVENAGKLGWVDWHSCG